ncbi:MAG: succinylglutamate desuccinylase/aspartoacylase family protein [Planctomycetia bacterium]|nr:succinylglutamate desuccinylase/aspartoacylase family protein [Planctomycetia bacterium]
MSAACVQTLLAGNANSLSTDYRCADGPHLLVTGGVHGDEFEPMAAIRRLMREVDPARLRGRLTLVPVANEAAFLRGARTAADGLDLARTCPGQRDGSITEQTAHALSQIIRAADYYIDLHTGGSTMSVLPLTGYKLVPDEAVREKQRCMAHAFNLPLVWGTDYRLEGRTLSVARDAGIPAIYAEYLGSGLCDPAGIEAYVAGCLNVMAELDMLDRERPESRVERTVNDFRESAGHMQIRNPAPITGFFEPSVRLGGNVEAGQPLGTVTDVLGDHVLAAPSQETGTVIVLRTFSRVHAGDTLAVILEDV